MTFADDAKAEHRIRLYGLAIVLVDEKANAPEAAPFEFFHRESEHDPPDPLVLFVRQDGQPRQFPFRSKFPVPARQLRLVLVLFD